MSFKKPILKFVIVPAILIVAIYFAGLLYIQNQWKYDFNETEMNSFVTQIKSSKPLPSGFYETLKSLDSNTDISMSRRVFYLIMPRFMSGHGLHKRSKNNYEKAAELLLDKNKMHLNSIFTPSVILAFGLEKRTSLDDCTNFYFHNLVINLKLDTFQRFNVIGVEQFANTFYSKRLSELDEDELVETISVFQLSTQIDTITDLFLQNRVQQNQHIVGKRYN